MQHLKELKEKINAPIPESILFRILFEMNKYYDQEFTNCVQKLQKDTNRVFNANERKILRKYFYYGDKKLLEELSIDSFGKIEPEDKDKQDIVLQTLNRLEKYDPEKIINSIIKRFDDIKNGNLSSNHSNKWLEYYDEKVHKEFDFSLAILSVKQDEFAKNGYNPSYLYERIRKLYDHLENYRHLVIISEENIFDKQGNNLTWTTLYKLGIYCENFLQFKDKYFPFKKEQQINELASFIKERTNYKQSLDLARQFYSSISYGFKFEDIYISNSAKKRFMVFKKISLDSRNVPCPSCMTTIQSSNSYPEVFLQSWECKNPNCPDRSKSGRGKRFDEFGTYRYFKVVENNPDDLIPIELYKKWKRDIFSDESSITQMILKYYSFAGERVAFQNNMSIDDFEKRRILPTVFEEYEENNQAVKSYSNLPIVVLLKSVKKNMHLSQGDREYNNKILAVHGNSTKFLQEISTNLIGSAITSPPYYNAREYSQWPTLILYLIDMMINAMAVFRVLDDKGTYLYNIGDIVSEDNVYVRSNMSKKRLQLGFLSAMIFEIAGFSLNGNIVWDKGEVQSKRNSTINLSAGYVKSINCYEHVLVFQKNNSRNVYDYVASFSPVIKINCHGENTYKHTAPYPLEMIDLLKPFIIDSKYIFDPFLGSGTTLKWCKLHNYKGIGVELNDEYYKLCLENINDR